MYITTNYNTQGHEKYEKLYKENLFIIVEFGHLNIYTLTITLS